MILLKDINLFFNEQIFNQHKKNAWTSVRWHLLQSWWNGCMQKHRCACVQSSQLSSNQRCIFCGLRVEKKPEKIFCPLKLQNTSLLVVEVDKEHFSLSKSLGCGIHPCPNTWSESWKGNKVQKDSCFPAYNKTCSWLCFEQLLFLKFCSD